MSYRPEELLYALHCEIWNISTLDPTDFTDKAQLLINSGLEQRVALMIRQGVNEYRGERALMKYIYILDKLMKINGYTSALQSHIVDIYSEIFLALLHQKCYNEVEELKILRKYWVGQVHPVLLNRIRQVVLAGTNIDLDYGFKLETINKIRIFYASKLGLREDEIAFHLPQIQTQIERLQTPRKYYMEPPRYSFAPTLPTLPAPPEYFVRPYEHIYQKNREKTSQTVYEVNYDHYTPLTPLNGLTPLTQRTMIRSGLEEGEELNIKRKRFCSQETKAARIDDHEGARPRKIVNRGQSLREQAPKNQSLDWRTILQRLRGMNMFSCKECGISFMSKEANQAHKSQHFRQKLSKVDKIVKRSKKEGLSSTEEWIIGKNHPSHSLDKFCISLSSTYQYTQYICHLCQSSFDLKFKNDQWLLSNSTNVLFNSKKVIMHKSCQIVLAQAQKEQEQAQN